jgi:dihydrofolate reductase
MPLLRAREEKQVIAAIWAQSANGVIGKDGAIPWRYPGDFRRFKRVTLGSTIVMGRKTWESIGSKPLPSRRNVVLSRRPRHEDGAVWCVDLEEALVFAKLSSPGDVWIIGGAEVYAAAIPFCDVLDITFVPDIVLGEGLTMAPSTSTYATLFKLGEEQVLQHEDELLLKRIVFVRQGLRETPYDLADNRRLQEQGVLTKKR